MGRKYHGSGKYKLRGGSGGGIAGMLVSALLGRRTHYGYAPRPRSVKSSLANALAKAVLKKIFK
jgi:hypothetical protein